MAKLIGPLFSEKAHGTLGGAITYSQRKTVNQVRRQTPAADFDTEARLTQRDRFYIATGIWNLLSDADKAIWAEIATKGYADIP